MYIFRFEEELQKHADAPRSRKEDVNIPTELSWRIFLLLQIPASYSEALEPRMVTSFFSFYSAFLVLGSHLLQLMILRLSFSQGLYVSGIICRAVKNEVFEGRMYVNG